MRFLGPHSNKLESVAASQAFGSLSLFRGFFGGWTHLREPRVCLLVEIFRQDVGKLPIGVILSRQS